MSRVLQGRDAERRVVRRDRTSSGTEAVPAAFGGVPGVEVFVGGNSAIFLDFLRRDRLVPMDRAGVRARPVVPAADGGVPLADPADQGDPDEPAFGGRRVRRRDPRVPEGRAGSTSSTRSGSSSSRARRSRHGCRCSCSRSCSGCRWTTTCSCSRRIREEYDKTHDNTEAVAYGLRTTAGIITGAAIIMVAVFIGFAVGPPRSAAADGLRPGGGGASGRHDRPDVPGAGGACACWATGTGTCRAGCSGSRSSTWRATSPARRDGDGAGHAGRVDREELRRWNASRRARRSSRRSGSAGRCVPETGSWSPARRRSGPTVRSIPTWPPRCAAVSRS